jgi:hypothetical protein
MKDSFSFLSLIYNQEKYIIEHLESVKYLVLTYAANINVDLIINDDASSDSTTLLVDAWLISNHHIFRHVTKIYNKVNIGTVASLNNIIKPNRAERWKIGAGDDVYSFENIFENTAHDNNTAFVSGFPLYIYDGEIRSNKISNLLITATQEVYKNKTLLYRFKHTSYNNAPSMTYSMKCLNNQNVIEYISKFKIIEDWPLQIAISREYNDYKFKLVYKIFTYYRKTSGSAYYVFNEKFNNDINDIYEDLISRETSIIEKIRLKSRRICFNSKNIFIKRIFNIDYYIFLFSSIYFSFSILKKYLSLDINFEKHKLHQKNIKILSDTFIESIKKN